MILCSECDGAIPSDDPRFSLPHLPDGWLNCQPCEDKLKGKKKHWATALREENEALKAALSFVLQGMRTIPQGRLDKYKTAKPSDHSLAYRKAVYEIDSRLLHLRGEALAALPYATWRNLPR